MSAEGTFPQVLIPLLALVPRREVTNEATPADDTREPLLCQSTADDEDLVGSGSANSLDEAENDDRLEPLQPGGSATGTQI